MADKRIKGITIELNGDATGLQAALKNVEKESNKLTSELREVERALKFDPSNTELLAQKQQILAEQIENTSKKLDTLRSAQEQVEQQFKNGEIGAEQYRAFMREIEATEGKLRAFKNQADDVNVRLEAQADTSGIDKMKAALKELPGAAKQAASEIGSALQTAAGVGTAALTGIVVGSDELNQALARLKTNASTAGFTLEVVEDGFKNLSAVTGDSRAAVETVSNLMATGFSDQQMTAVLEEITGAYIAFSDTLSAEGIADGIQETFGVGEAAGSFLELLERSGVDIEKFNEGLAKAKQTGQETDYVLQQLSELGLKSNYEEYQKLNPEVAKNAEATINMQLALAELAVILTPLVTTITEVVTKLVEWANNNQTLAAVLAVISVAITGISGAIMILSPIIGALTPIFATVSTAVAEAGGAMTVLKTVLGALTGPIGLVISAITGIVTAFVVAYNKVEWFRDGVNAVWDGIKKATQTAFDNVSKFIKTYIDDAVEFAEGLLDKFKAFWDENGAAIVRVVKTHFEQVKKDVETILNAIQKVFETVWPIISKVIKVAWETIQLTVGTAIDIVLGLITTGMKLLQGDWSGAWEAIKKTATNIMDNIIDFFKDINLYDIGKDIIQGLINGIGDMANAVWEKAKSIGSGIISSIRDAVDSHSPSRDAIKVGHDIGDGLVIGLDNSQSKVKSASESLADTIMNAFNNRKQLNVDDFANEELKALANTSNKLLELDEQTADGRLKIQEEFNKYRVELREEFANEFAKWQDVYDSVSERTGNSEFAEKLANLYEGKPLKVYYAELELINSDEREALEKFEKKLEERFELQKQYVEQAKALNVISLTDELDMYDQFAQMYAEDSERRKYFEQQAVTTRQAINDKLTSLNDEYIKKIQGANKKYAEDKLKIDQDYAAKMQKVRDDEAKGIKELNDKYDDALKSRTQSIYNAFGLFDSAKTSRISGQRLTKNLESQLKVFEDYQKNIQSLAGRGIDEGLLSELQAMGPDAAGEIAALNRMSDGELNNYVSLWKEKSNLARSQAEFELTGMREDTARQIEELRKETADQLEVYQREWDSALVTLRTNTAIQLETYKNEWMLKIREVKDGTKLELNNLVTDMPTIGRNTIQGMMDGLAEMTPALLAQAKAIANAIKETIQSALDIHSPSRVMKGFGINIGQGLIEGMDEMVSKVASASARLANAVSNNSVMSSTASYDYSKNVNAPITIQTTNSGAKEMERAMRRVLYGI